MDLNQYLKLADVSKVLYGSVFMALLYLEVVNCLLEQIFPHLIRLHLYAWVDYESVVFVSESIGALEIFENCHNFILYEGDWQLIIRDELL